MPIVRRVVVSNSNKEIRFNWFTEEKKNSRRKAKEARVTVRLQMRKTIFQRSSLFSRRRCSTRRKFAQTSRSIFAAICFCFHLYFFLLRLSRTCSILFDRLVRISRLISQWTKIIRSIFSALHLFIATSMVFIAKLYQIFDLLTILLEPLAHRRLDKAVRAFSHGFHDYYSSNGACYTLKERTNQIFRRVRARWKKRSFPSSQDDDDDDLFYDANEFF